MGALVAIVLWLWATGELSLYIHPRYHSFTAVMAVLAVAMLVTYAFVRARTPAGADHDDHDHEPPGSAVPLALSSVLSVGALLVLLIVPPATLTTLTAENRAINQSGLGDSEEVFAQAQTGESEVFASFTVREWAGILRQTADPAFYQGKPVDVVGFVTPDPTEADLFYVTRFVVSCCSVDAQPVGVAVWAPGWAQTYQPNQWVQVTGEFVISPNPGAGEPIVLQPRDIVPAEEPDEPYLF